MEYKWARKGAANAINPVPVGEATLKLRKRRELNYPWRLFDDGLRLDTLKRVASRIPASLDLHTSTAIRLQIRLRLKTGALEGEARCMRQKRVL